MGLLDKLVLLKLNNPSFASSQWQLPCDEIIVVKGMEGAKAKRMVAGTKLTYYTLWPTYIYL